MFRLKRECAWRAFSRSIHRHKFDATSITRINERFIMISVISQTSKIERLINTSDEKSNLTMCVCVCIIFCYMYLSWRQVLRILLRLRMKGNPIVVETLASIYFFTFSELFLGKTENNLFTQKAILLANRTQKVQRVEDVLAISR